MNHVVISTNNNPRYKYYTPLVKWAWEKLEWNLITLSPFQLPPYKEETITQCVRLYACILKSIQPDDIVMTSDADMMPLSNYWQPDNVKLNIYGHDLTDYKHTPICYIAAPKHIWGELMHLNSANVKELMDRDLKVTKALSDNFCDWWQVDQDIITERINDFKERNPGRWVNIDRGTESTGYPAGRFDRSVMKYPENGLVDFHLPADGWNHTDIIKEVMTKAFNELPEWIDQYTIEFKAEHNL